tara:strand:- start:18783 stop:19187 length:405 start_codon:yes stop_codon:yes gene_type:complete
MAYLGKPPELGSYKKLDDISSSFDGSETTFNLELGGSPYITTNPFTLMVVLNGAVKNPGVEFTVNRSEITFSSPPAASPTSFYIMSLGNTFHTGGQKSIPVFNQSGTRLTLPVTATTLPVISRTDTIPVLINPA